MLNHLKCWWYGHVWFGNFIIQFRPPKDQPLTNRNGIAQYWRHCPVCGRQEVRWADETEWVVTTSRQIPIDLGVE